MGDVSMAPGGGGVIRQVVSIEESGRLISGVGKAMGGYDVNGKELKA